MSEAQRLADWIEDDMTCAGDAEIAAELRRLAPMEAELAATHKALAEAVLKAEQGWSRYENANRLSNSLQEELAALRALLSEPALFVSPEQLLAHKNIEDGEFGTYLPARKTAAGKFTQPLYAIKDAK
jgi:hypothetical protein